MNYSGNITADIQDLIEFSEQETEPVYYCPECGLKFDRDGIELYNNGSTDIEKRYCENCKEGIKENDTDRYNKLFKSDLLKTVYNNLKDLPF